jgi:hypothetical protein
MTASLPIGSVTSFRRDGARVRPVSVNHNQESGVGGAEGASGSSATTGIIAGGFPVSMQVVSVSRKSNFRGNFYWRGFRMCRSHAHRQSQSRSRTAATATIPLRMILRTGPLVGPNSIIPGLPEANAACKKEIGPRGGLFSRCENFFLSELDEPLLTEFSAGSLVSFSNAKTLMNGGASAVSWPVGSSISAMRRPRTASCARRPSPPILITVLNTTSWPAGLPCDF